MSDATERLNAALEGRYAIEREGGMAMGAIHDPSLGSVDTETWEPNP